MKRTIAAVIISFAFSLAACGGETSGENNSTDAQFPSDTDVYSFESRFEPGADSVSYSGQVARQVLIEDLKSFTLGLTEAIDAARYEVGGEGSVVAALDFYLRFDSDTYGEESHALVTEPAAAQATYDDVSTGKDLISKLAGNDATTDHKDWSTSFAGWSDATLAEHGGSITSPEGFVVALFEQTEANAMTRADGVDRFAPDGTTTLPVHVSEDGRDLAQLTQKFLTGAVAFSQGADDYLDDDVEGKGLLSPNTRDETSAYTVLEHAWDEGFGYFGASKYYGQLTDEEIASTYKDVDGDGAIDLLSEYNFGASANAAKRDLGATGELDLSGDTFTAFWNGRRLLSKAGETLTDAELTELKGYRDIAVSGWEKSLAATAVHYINETIVATEAIGTDAYIFVDHAKAWSEMKGFGLAFQFNPRSPLSDNDFATIHELFRDAPELSSEDGAKYVADLKSARDILAAAYDFADEDVQGW